MAYLAARRRAAPIRVRKNIPLCAFFPRSCDFFLFLFNRRRLTFKESSSPFVPLFPLSRVTSGIDVQESAEQNFCRRLCGDRAAPSVPFLGARGASFWSISPHDDINRLCIAQFCGTLALSSIVIRCFNHCLQTAPNNVLRVLLSFRWNELFITRNVSC